MVERGVLIETADPKPEIRKNAEIARDWEYSGEAKYLYGMAVLFKDRFLDPVLHTDRGRLPNPVISFDNLRNMRTLAAYTLHRNPQGLLDEITFNTEHYEDQKNKKVWRFGRWPQLETLLHEQVHLWQQNFGEDPVKPGKVYHNKEFVEKCESLGLHPVPVKGCHVAVADGVFAQLMAELGIERPEDVPTMDWTRAGGRPITTDWFRFLSDLEGKGRKGASTLKKWCCPECGMNVRMGKVGDPMLRHHTCEEAIGRPVFLIPGDVYVAKK